jgi:hypothetical protein
VKCHYMKKGDDDSAIGKKRMIFCFCFLQTDFYHFLSPEWEHKKDNLERVYKN